MENICVLYKKIIYREIFITNIHIIMYYITSIYILFKVFNRFNRLIDLTALIYIY